MAQSPFVEFDCWLAEAHDVEQQLGRIALREICEFVDRKAIQASLDRGQHQGDGFGDKAGAAAGAVDRRPANAASLGNSLADVRRKRGRVMEFAAGRDDICAAGEEAADLVKIAEQRHVEDTVGAKRNNLVDARCRFDTDRVDAA
jgi:hypothetical protein